MYNVDIQEAKFNDLKSIINIAIEAYKDHYTHLWKDGGKSYISESFNMEAFSKYINPSHKKSLYSIKVNNQLMGFLSLGFGYTADGKLQPDHMELERIYFVREATCKGIGSMVIPFIDTMARNKEYHTIWLKAMKNSPAVNFYQKHGWKIIDETCLDHPEVLPSESEMFIMIRNL